MKMSLFAVILLAALASAGREGPIGSQSVQQPPPAAGVITGTIIDEVGRPLVGFRAQAVGRKKKWNGPYYEIPTGRPDESDDRGQFRLHSLPPGQYIVAVSMQPEQPASATRPPAPTRPEFQRTYNPGTTSLADAQVISVAAGQEHPVSIRLTPARFVSVSGVAKTSDGAPAANFDISLRGGPATVGHTGPSSGFMTTVVAGTRTTQDGSFSLLRVPAGTYTLIVTNGYTRRGRPLEIKEIPIEVRGVALTDISVTTARGAVVSGRLEWGDPGPAPWPVNSTSLGTLRAAAVGRESDFAKLDTDVKPDGTFQFTDLYGLRQIQAMSLPFYWTIKSVEAPQNLTVGRNLRIEPGTVVTDLKVIVTNRVGMLMATVSDENARPFLTGSVLLMPRDPTEVDPLGWGFRATQMNYGSMGTSYYTMDRILPGSYLVVAIDVEPSRLAADTDLMERARAAATVVNIEPGQARLDLRIVRLRQFVESTAKH